MKFEPPIVLVAVYLLLCTDVVIATECILFEEADTKLPETTRFASMDVKSIDLDKDGNLDIVIAVEYGQNILLRNKGAGVFVQANRKEFQISHDSEEVSINDFNKDEHPDLVFVSEDTEANEFYINRDGSEFLNQSNRIPVTGISNAVVSLDVNNDKYPDLIIGNKGSNTLLLNNKSGGFVDVTSTRISGFNDDNTQDLLILDVDNDQDMDIYVANEGQNRLYINNGEGFFREDVARIPEKINESREAITTDIDHDGDLDIFIANVRFSMQVSAVDQLLINDGDGYFTEAPQDIFEANPDNNFTAVFVDLDQDGYQDILTGSSEIFTHNSGQIYAYRNNTKAGFEPMESCELFKSVVLGNVFSFDIADYNNDGIVDMYIANRISQSGYGGQDRLFFGTIKEQND